MSLRGVCDVDTSCWVGYADIWVVFGGQRRAGYGGFETLYSYLRLMGFLDISCF